MTDRFGVSTEQWRLAVHRFSIDEHGEIQLSAQRADGRPGWIEPSALARDGKERFAISRCTYRDGTVYDEQGRPVLTAATLSEESFDGRKSVIAWGRNGTAHQGRRLVISRHDAPSTSEEPSSPSDKPTIADRFTNLSLREWQRTIDRCGHVYLCAREQLHSVAVRDGTLVERSDRTGSIVPLDCARFGITHLRAHEGRLFDAQTGYEVQLRSKIDLRSCSEGQLLHLRSSGCGEPDYLISGGLPPGMAVRQLQLVRTDSVRDHNGQPASERLYSLTRKIVPEADAVREFRLSPDRTSLSGFVPAASAEDHPELGTLRFVFKPEGKEQIRVYEKRSYESDSVWTFVERCDSVEIATDCRGSRQRTVRTGWVKNPGYRVRERDPHAGEDRSAYPVVPEGGDPFAVDERAARKSTQSGPPVPESAPPDPAGEHAGRQAPLERLPLRAALVDPKRAAELRGELQRLIEETEESMGAAIMDGGTPTAAWAEARDRTWSRFFALIDEQTERAEGAARKKHHELITDGTGGGAPLTADEQERILKLADYYIDRGAHAPAAGLVPRRDWMKNDAAEFLERVVYRATGASYLHKYEEGRPPPGDRVLDAFRAIAASAESDFLLGAAIGQPSWVGEAYPDRLGRSWRETRAMLEESIRRLTDYEQQRSSESETSSPLEQAVSVIRGDKGRSFGWRAERNGSSLSLPARARTAPV